MQQVFLFDFDNKKDGINLTCNDKEYVTEEQILNYCEQQKILPTFIYKTFSNTEITHKFRLVYVFEESILKLSYAQEIIMTLLEKLKSFNPDLSKKNVSDMFFGGNQIYYSSENFYRIEVQ